jgi:S1-C subfamily serine protease
MARNAILSDVDKARIHQVAKPLLTALFLWVFTSSSAFPDQIPPFFIDCVVALGRLQPPAPGQTPVWVTEASGFFYGVPMDTETDPQKHQYAVYLITNRHVLANHDQIFVRLNAQKAGAPVREIPLSLKDDKGQELWFSHPNAAIDVSVLHINAGYLREQALQSTFFEADHHVADKAKMKDIGLAIGNDVFVLGFPMGISGTEQHNYVIARHGTIARINDVLETSGLTFLIDAFVFPGNSGGPVVSVPNLNAIAGTKHQDHAYLIGVVRGYMPYHDILVSKQTGEARMVSEENSGLAEVIPIDYVNETIEASRRAAPNR